MPSSTVIASLLFAGMSIHHSDNHAPAQGYQWWHQTLGVQVETSLPHEWRAGVLLMPLGKDSFGEDMQLHAATLRRVVWHSGAWDVSLGAGLGWASTSYYDGVYAAPMAEVSYALGQNPALRLGTQLAHQVAVDNVDSVTAVQLKLMWEF